MQKSKRQQHKYCVLDCTQFSDMVRSNDRHCRSRNNAHRRTCKQRRARSPPMDSKIATSMLIGTPVRDIQTSGIQIQFFVNS